MVKSYRKIGAQSDLSKVQNNVEVALQPLIASPIINGNLLTKVELTIGTTEVDHKLGRDLRGWIVVGQSDLASIWDSQATNVRSARTLILNSDADTVISLWVF